MRRHSRILFGHVLALAVALACVGAAQAAPVVDQQQLVYNGGTSARTLPGYTVWQSFTAGITGTLTEIDMGFFNDMSGSAQLEILAGAGTGGAVLQTLTVPVVGITQPGVTWNAWGVNVPVTAGSVYTFNITPNAATLPDPYGVAIGSNSPYAGGTMGLNDPSGSYTTSFDIVFRTYVDTGVTPTYTISASAAPVEGGAISGDGSYAADSIATLSATPSAGYSFVNWTENGAEVSASADYSFAVSGDRTLVANFAAVTPPPPVNGALVVPNAYQNAPAEYQVAGGAGGHYQQIFDRSQFWPAGETHTISAIAWRPGNALSPGVYSWTISQFEVYICTTNNAVGALSTAFADNYADATDRTLVYSGPITFTANVTSTGGVNECDVVIPFQVPFQYTPGNGNLLIDVTGYDFYENLWNAQVELVAASSVTSYLWGDHRYSTGTLNGFGGAGLVTQFATDYTGTPPTLPTPVSLTIGPNTLFGGDSAVGTITISGAAPSGGLALSLSSTDPAASVPASVTVAEGTTSASFTIATAPVTSATSATVTASSGVASVSAAMTINPPPVYPSSLTLSPSSLIGGATATAMVTLSGPAPAGGQVVSVTSSNAAATVPASITVPQGAASASFTVTTKSVSTKTACTIAASCNGTTASAVLTVDPPAGAVLYNLDIPSSIKAGSKVSGKIEITKPAPPGGVVVSLSSSNVSAVGVPSSVKVASGKTQATFTVTAGKVTKSTTAAVTAKLNGSQMSTTVTVNP